MTICSTKGEKNGSCQASPPDGETHRAEDGTIGGTRSIAPSMSMPSAAAREDAAVRLRAGRHGSGVRAPDRAERPRAVIDEKAGVRETPAVPASGAMLPVFPEASPARFTGGDFRRPFLRPAAPAGKRLERLPPLDRIARRRRPRIPPLPGENHRNVLPLPARGLPSPSREKHHGPAACPPLEGKASRSGHTSPFAGGASGDAGCGTLMASALPW